MSKEIKGLTPEVRRKIVTRYLGIDPGSSWADIERYYRISGRERDIKRLNNRTREEKAEELGLAKESSWAIIYEKELEFKRREYITSLRLPEQSSWEDIVEAATDIERQRTARKFALLPEATWEEIEKRIIDGYDSTEVDYKYLVDDPFVNTKKRKEETRRNIEEFNRYKQQVISDLGLTNLTCEEVGRVKALHFLMLGVAIGLVAPHDDLTYSRISWGNFEQTMERLVPDFEIPQQVVANLQESFIGRYRNELLGKSVADQAK